MTCAIAESLEPAVAGVETVVSAVHGFNDPARDSLAAVDRDGNANLLSAARAAGAQFVLISTVGAAPDSPMELFRMKYMAEERAADLSFRARSCARRRSWSCGSRCLNRPPPAPAAHSCSARVRTRSTSSPSATSPLWSSALSQIQALRGQTLEIGGPANLTFDQLAGAVQTACGRTKAPRHVPRLMLRLMASTVGRIKPQLGRQARAALAMDRTDLTFDATPLRRLYPELPFTAAAEVLAGLHPQH